MAKQTGGQKKTVERVMHEFKHGELKSGGGKGPKVKSRQQAIAIALHESGSTNQESPKTNKQNLSRTTRKERAGETGRDAAEGTSKAALYEQAKKKNIPGRSRMGKDELKRALNR